MNFKILFRNSRDRLYNNFRATTSTILGAGRPYRFRRHRRCRHRRHGRRHQRRRQFSFRRRYSHENFRGLRCKDGEVHYALEQFENGTSDLTLSRELLGKCVSSASKRVSTAKRARKASSTEQAQE